VPGVGDGFRRLLPVPDSIDTAAAAGVVAVIQPGGSKTTTTRWPPAIGTAFSMIFTGRRHFKH